MSWLRSFLHHKAAQIEGAIEYALKTETCIVECGYNYAIINDVIVGFTPEKKNKKLFVMLEFSNEELEAKIEEYNKLIDTL